METDDAPHSEMTERLKRLLSKHIAALETVPEPKTALEADRMFKAILTAKKLADALYQVPQKSDEPKAAKAKKPELKKAENVMQDDTEEDRARKTAALEASAAELERKLLRFVDSRRGSVVAPSARSGDAQSSAAPLAVLEIKGAETPKG